MRSSSKSGCQAAVNTVALTRHQTETIIETVKSSFNSSAMFEGTCINNVNFCKISTSVLTHSNHVIEVCDMSTQIVHSSNDIINRPEMYRCMIGFMSMSDRSDGFMMRLNSLLEQSFPGAVISYNAVRNFVSKVMHDEKELKNLSIYRRK